MNAEIHVGPPVINISQGRTFMVTTQAGDILSDSDGGVYAIDTRFISFYRLSMGSQHFSPPFSPLRIRRGDSALFSPR